MTEQQPINQAQRISVRDDEINLVELFAKIWQRKWWVLACTLLATISVLFNGLLAKPVYQAEIFLMPPTIADLEELNQPVFLGERGFYCSGEANRIITSSAVYAIFLNQLKSKAASNKFLKSASATLNVKISRETNSFVNVTLRGGESAIAVILNDYVESVQHHTAELLASQRRAQLKNMIRDTEWKIEVKGELKAENPKGLQVMALNERLKYFQKITVSAENIIPITVDQTASTRRQPSKLNKALILMIGSVIGCLLGLIMALVIPMRWKERLK